ncbi:zona pellucida sperm-binding protein 3 [Nothobranchius furzeri]|uniref:Zona pellucida sperm-binding protein 3 n=1 Tax=Nothobranchius furzeri TaxID=105023 RepID=A0A8C6LWI7_NOTFU|nr:zona pellucida sperm-binding protein 3-like [Nothobranchius furzeri]
MVSVGYPVALVLLISLTIDVTDAIRTLKEGPMIDAEGREYKSVSPVDNSRPKTREKPTIRVHCTEVSMIVFIQADFYRTGRLASPGELYLGDPKSSQSGRCYAVPGGDGVYVIEADLHDCGSKLTVSDDDVIYSNNLIFSPAVGHHGITRVMEAVVPVSCHYKGKHTVSSITQQKQPLAFSASEKFPAGGSPFSLKLMTDDWSGEMLSNTFYLGDPLHLKASYSGPDSRQIFVDSCVATVMPDARSVPRYFFIENNGCFADAKDGGVNSLFLPRSSPDSLLFQLNAFLFHKELRTTIYLTCKLKASPELKSSPVDKACNYIQNRWTSVDGNDGVCWCCNRVCRNKASKDDLICDTLTLGPLVIFPRN